MKLQRGLLALSAIAFGGFGGWFLLSPSALADLAEIGVSGPSARAEVRAMYGGLELGVAAFLFWAWLRPERVAIGLWAALFAFGGLAAGRAAGIALEGGVVAGAIWGALAAEVVACLLLVWGIRAGGGHLPAR
jgi:hypothetical protein